MHVACSGAAIGTGRGGLHWLAAGSWQGAGLLRAAICPRASVAGEELVTVALGGELAHRRRVQLAMSSQVRCRLSKGFACSRGFAVFLPSYGFAAAAAIAQLGERQTEDLKVPGSIPGLGTAFNCRDGTGGTEVP